MADKQHITLKIGAHNLPYTIDANLEEDYRKAANLVNQRYEYYRSRMPKASAEQVWVYVALELSLNLCHDARIADLKPVMDKVEKMNQQISNIINTDL